MFRNGVASTCGTAKAFPGTVAGTYNYNSYTYTNNTAGTQCVTVTLTGNATNCNVQSAAYLGSFNPADIAQNYIGDSGVSTLNGTTGTYSFNLAAGQQTVVNVNDSYSSGCDSYTLTINGAPPNPVIPPVGAATPELGSGELLATGLLPIGAILLYRRRRARRATQQ